jgi:hypothetical protein
VRKARDILYKNQPRQESFDEPSEGTEQRSIGVAPRDLAVRIPRRHLSLFAKRLTGCTASDEQVTSPSRSQESPDFGCRDSTNVVFDKASRSVVSFVRLLAASVGVYPCEDLDFGIEQPPCQAASPAKEI